MSKVSKLICLSICYLLLITCALYNTDATMKFLGWFLFAYIFFYDMEKRVYNILEIPNRRPA